MMRWLFSYCLLAVCGAYFISARAQDAPRQRETIMSDLVVIEFPTEAKAEEVRQKLLDMQKEYLIELSDAVIAIKQPNGQIKLNQLYHPATAGAAAGTIWGAIVGLIFLMPLLGAAVGAASGAIGGALTDVGINDQFMKDVAASLESGNAALFLLIRKVTADKVLADLKGVGGKVLRTSFDHTKEEALRAALAAPAETPLAPAGLPTAPAASAEAPTAPAEAPPKTEHAS
jgi:uncharacterized membrane protein